MAVPQEMPAQRACGNAACTRPNGWHARLQGLSYEARLLLWSLIDNNIRILSAFLEDLSSPRVADPGLWSSILARPLPIRDHSSAPHHAFAAPYQLCCFVRDACNMHAEPKSSVTWFDRGMAWSRMGRACG